MNHLDGIAGRALGQRLNGSRERKRAADNDNRQPEVARVSKGEEAPALAMGKGDRLSSPRDGQAQIAAGRSRPAGSLD